MRVKYSPTELALLTLLLKDTTKHWDINQLSDLYYGQRGSRPRHARIVVNKAIKELMDKATINRENFKIERIEQAGKKGDLIRAFKKKG